MNNFVNYTYQGDSLWINDSVKHAGTIVNIHIYAGITMNIADAAYYRVGAMGRWSQLDLR